VAGAAIMAGAAFAPNIFKVQGMNAFTDQSYHTLAGLLLLQKGFAAELASDSDDHATKAMARWLIERDRRLPAVLAAWRQPAKTKGIKIKRVSA